MKNWKKLLLVGLFSGIFLGLLLKMIQAITGKAVYTLLMNVDYFPVIGDWHMPELIEFTLHLGVSIVIVIILFEVLQRFTLEKKLVPYLVLNGLIGVLIYPTTALSERTPAVTDSVALLYWIAGHLAYGFITWLGIRVFLKGESS